jgi:tryptophan synthase beta chain
MTAYDQYLAGDLMNYSLTDEDIANNIEKLEGILK